MAAFVDTNILLYAFSNASGGQIEKTILAKRLIGDLIRERSLLLSSQVLSEFIANATRKGTPPLALADVAEIVNELSRQTVLPVDATLVIKALQRVEQSRISYWDALIVEAAICSGATVLLTEDMHHGMRYGQLELSNPFLT